ncbi:hypothetical protein BN977_01189 [Mycolicibacterium cosmeticum]|uniref:Uncharacterized protein n=1 Tax=Mycolicibacterium cosmeticum TaxID=258533 RepID=W9AUX4_MYCCO|nr:hypothetical protein BN977_01189 [Mycolicibacterium cosmeticum]
MRTTFAALLAAAIFAVLHYFVPLTCLPLSIGCTA